MRAQRRELSQLPPACSLLQACNSGAPRQQAAGPCRPLAVPNAGQLPMARRPLLLSTQLTIRCSSALGAVGGSSRTACILVQHARARLWRSQPPSVGTACGCRHCSRGRGTAVAVAQQSYETSSSGEEHGEEMGGGSEGEAEGDKGNEAVNPDSFIYTVDWRPGDGERPTSQQQLLLLRLLSSPLYPEAHKKKILLTAMAFGIDIVPVLEKSGLGPEWLNGVDAFNEIEFDYTGYEDAPTAFWEELSSQFEDTVKGRRKVLEQISGPKKGFGKGASANSGGGKGRKTKPRKPKSSYALAAEVAMMEETRRIEQEIAEQEAREAAIEKLLADWVEEDKRAYRAALYFWGLATYITHLGVRQFMAMSTLPDSTASLACCIELLMVIRAKMWRSVTAAYERGSARSKFGPQIGNAMQLMLARRVVDMTQQAVNMRNEELWEADPDALEGSSTYIVNHAIEQGAKTIIQIAQESPTQLPFPSAAAFAPAPPGGLCMAEEILARQVAGSVEAWRELSLYMRLERLISPGFNLWARKLHNTIRHLEGEERAQAAYLLGIVSNMSSELVQEVAGEERMKRLESPPSEAEGPAAADVDAGEVPEPDLAGSAKPDEVASSEPDQAIYASSDAEPDQAIYASSDAEPVPAIFASSHEEVAAAEDLAEADTAADALPAELSDATSSNTDVSEAQPEGVAWAGVYDWVAAAESSEELEAVSGKEGERPSAAHTSPPESATAVASAGGSEGFFTATLDASGAEEELLSERSSDQHASSSAGKASAEPSGEEAGDADGCGSASEGSDGATAAVGPSEQPAERSRDDASRNGAALTSSASRNGAAPAAGEPAGGADAAGAASGGWVSLSDSGIREEAASSAVDGRIQGTMQGKEVVFPPRGEAAAGSDANSAARSASSYWGPQLANRPVLPPSAATFAAEVKKGKKEGPLSDVQKRELRHLERRMDTVPPPQKGRINYSANAQSDGTYMSKQLLPHDQRHWKAAGILLFTHGPDGSLHLLLGKIDSGREDNAPRWRRQEGWWILGGKRDASDYCAEATAIREMTEETAGILSGHHVCGNDLGEVLWYPPGLYAVFPYELKGQPDIPGRYARVRAVRGRMKGRRRTAYTRQGNPRPMSALAWVPLRDLIDGRCQLHWILEDMLRRTPLLPYLLQMERLGGGLPASGQAPPFKGPMQRTGGADWAPAQQIGNHKGANRWERVDPHSQSAKAAAAANRPATAAPAPSPPAEQSADPALGSARSNGAVDGSEVGSGEASSPLEASLKAAAAAAGLVRPRGGVASTAEEATPRDGVAAEESSFSAIAEAAREFLTGGAAAEGTQRETGAAAVPAKKPSRPRKLRRSRWWKRSHIKR